MIFYEENPAQITEADVVVGIAASNDGETIARATEQVDKGLREYFPDMRSAIINCDNNSSDGTREAFFAAPGSVARIYVSSESGVRGKGKNLRNFFQRAARLNPKALITVEAGIKNISPAWVRNLGAPILKGAGFVCPLYVRHKYEATLTTSVIYPLFRSLYGRRVRQCTAGDYGFSPKLLDFYLQPPFWNQMLDNYGIDVFMANVALASGCPIVQSVMGTPKMHRFKEGNSHLSEIFHEVVGTIFDLMQVYEGFWKQVKWSKPTALFGTDVQEVETPLPVEINTKRLHEMFLDGFDKYFELWERIYGPTVTPKLQEIRSIELQHFSFPTQTWMTILFDSAAAYRRMSLPERTNLLDALLPLYLGKVLSYVKKTERMSLQQAEEYIENECVLFEENKPYIIKVWTKGEVG
jgi:hypothetical protein